MFWVTAKLSCLFTSSVGTIVVWIFVSLSSVLVVEPSVFPFYFVCCCSSLKYLEYWVLKGKCSNIHVSVWWTRVVDNSKLNSVERHKRFCHSFLRDFGSFVVMLCQMSKILLGASFQCEYPWIPYDNISYQQFKKKVI